MGENPLKPLDSLSPSHPILEKTPTAASIDTEAGRLYHHGQRAWEHPGMFRATETAAKTGGESG